MESCQCPIAAHPAQPSPISPSLVRLCIHGWCTGSLQCGPYLSRPQSQLPPALLIVQCPLLAPHAVARTSAVVGLSNATLVAVHARKGQRKGNETVRRTQNGDEEGRRGGGRRGRLVRREQRRRRDGAAAGGRWSDGVEGGGVATDRGKAGSVQQGAGRTLQNSYSYAPPPSDCPTHDGRWATESELRRKG